jgi:hypothetical protein
LRDVDSWHIDVDPVGRFQVSWAARKA